MDTNALTQLVKETATAAGFDACGAAPAAILTDEASRLQQWLDSGYHAGMTFMERSVDKRANPSLLVENVLSVVVLLTNYKPPHTQPPDAPQVAYFAYGRDYHDWLRAKLNTIITAVQARFPAVHLRGFTDTAPVFERAWAVRAGLGWIGKNNLFISQRFGSFVFLSTLLLDAELEYDTPPQMPSCGACTRCINACTARALRAPYVLDARRCIAYHTIECKEETTIDTHGYCFGCDRCQRACPWNEHAPPHTHADWPAIPEIISFTASDWRALDEAAFRRIFAASPLRRAGFSKLIHRLH